MKREPRRATTARVAERELSACVPPEETGTPWHNLD
jgi:hypothetical protein